MFTASIMPIGTPSDGAPVGAPGKIILPMEEAVKSASTMNLMAVDCQWIDWLPEECMGGHDLQNKIGVVEKCYVEGQSLKVDGFIYCNDFPEIAYFIKNATSALGFSVECYFNASQREDGDYDISDVTFTGVAILFKKLAAYENTCIDYIAAQKKKENLMDEKQFKEFAESVKAMFEAQKEYTDKAIEKFTGEIGGLKETMMASKEVSVPVKEFKVEEAEEFVELKEKFEKLEAEKARIEQEKADLEAKRETAKNENTEGQFSKDSTHIWDEGYKKGFKNMVSFMKSEIAKGKE